MEQQKLEGINPPKEPRLPTGISPSSMDLYHQCPRRFEIQKIQGGYEPAGRPALLGTFVHRSLELLMQLPPAERTIEAARDCARQAWPETEREADFSLLELDEDGVKEFKGDAWWSIKGYFETEDPTTVDVAATEKFMQCEIDGVRFRGIIDRVDREGRSLIVSDYKAGKVPDQRYRGPKIEQLNFYAAMLGETWGTTPTKGRLIFTTHAEVIETRFTKGSVAGIIQKVIETWRSVEADFASGSFAPKVGPLCAYCPALATCPDGMGEVLLRHKKGRVKKDAPGYALVARPKAQP